jgi:uncharacterized repeat protein (TIGR01451 family)
VVRRPVGLRTGAIALVVVAVSLVASATAGAQVVGNQSADRWVTIAARECDSYRDIRANLARNNLMESLQDLGADTLYESGQPVDPRTELAGQPKCRPITGWRFTFGAGIAGQVDGPWGALSIVSSPDGGQQPVTKADVPLRDFNGNPVGGGQKIQGAVTIGLNHDQVERSSQNSLWLQGGTTTDPDLFNDPQFAGRYGFGALRCALDDLNGDNVETIQFPTGARHQFCYAYYVTPPPTSGTIVIRKEVEGSSTSETFHYTGNLSYNEGGAFDLSAGDGDPDSTEFVRGETRAGEDPWTVVEAAQAGWTLTGLSCTSQSSTTVTDVASRTVQITLAAGDTVTCTFTNRLTPPAGALALRKVTLDGVGSFPFTVDDAEGRAVFTRSLRTRSPGGVGAVSVFKLDPGRYRISETLPVSSTGEWRLARVSCNGSAVASGKPVIVNITAGRGAVCTFTNAFDLVGQINVSGVSLGGLGAAWYVTTQRGDTSRQRRQLARSTRQGRPADARGQTTDELPFGTYVIQQSAALGTARGAAPSTAQLGSSLDDWSLIGVLCNGRPVPFAQGRVIVRISRTTPEQDCRFINLRQAAPAPPPPEPPTPPGPTPTPPPTPPDPTPIPGEATPDLALTKTLMSTSSAQPPILTFRLRVTNRSAVVANRVVVADRLAPGTAIVSARPSQGRCATSGTRLVVCPLGDLDPGESATIRVRVQQFDPSAGVNVGAVGSGSPEDVLRNNAAAARFSGFGPNVPIACPAATRPVAHASC